MEKETCKRRNFNTYYVIIVKSKIFLDTKNSMSFVVCVCVYIYIRLSHI